jgi:hypothetical protein
VDEGSAVSKISVRFIYKGLFGKIRQVCNRTKRRGLVLTKEIGWVGWFGFVAAVIRG